MNFIIKRRAFEQLADWLDGRREDPVSSGDGTTTTTTARVGSPFSHSRLY